MQGLYVGGILTDFLLRRGACQQKVSVSGGSTVIHVQCTDVAFNQGINFVHMKFQILL